MLNPWINNQSLAGEGDTYQIIDPWSGEVCENVIGAGEAVIDQAVASAHAAFEENHRRTVLQRSEWLVRGAGEIERAEDEIVRASVRHIGKPRRAATFEVKRTADFMRAVGRAVLEMAGEVLPMDAAAAGAGTYGLTKRVPYGVVAAVTPFNAPANLLMQKLAPAVVTGNAVVVKPSLPGTAVALAIARCLAAAGLPSGLLSVVPGDKEEAMALAAHPGIAAVSITGGTAAGDALARIAGAKPFMAELGGNSANIVCADAEIGDAAKRIAISAFEAAGQQCISAQRVIVEKAVMNRFLDRFVAAAQAMKSGDPNEAATDIGPVVNVSAADRIMSLVKEAVADGAKIALEPRRDGCLISPGILVNPPSASRAVRDEIFGPLAVVLEAVDVDEGVKIANDTPYGLQASVFTSSLKTGFRMFEDLRVGSLWLNEGSRFRLDMYPFGGTARSGYGREGVRYALEAWTQWKFMGIRVTD